MASETPPLVVSEPNGIATTDEHAFVASASPAMRTLERTVQDIACTDMPVLIIGESGTGKGALAYRIHQLSHRRLIATHDGVGNVRACGSKTNGRQQQETQEDAFHEASPRSIQKR